MAQRPRNPSPYQTSRRSLTRGYKRKVSDYQKPIQAKRNRNINQSRIHDFSFQNHHGKNDLKGNRMQNNQYFGQKNHNTETFNGNVGFRNNTPSLEAVAFNSRYGTQNNHRQGHNPEPNTLPMRNFTQYHPNNFSNQSSLNMEPASVYSNDYGVIKHSPDFSSINIPLNNTNTIENNNLHLNEETNQLLLSLDPELINLVANHKIIPAPEITDKSSLKIRRQNVIDALYNKEDKKCPNCGLRFSKDDKASLDAHLDEHYRINSENNKSRRGEHWKRRAWYPRFAVIKSLTEEKSSDTNEQKMEEVKEEIPPMIPIDNILLAINNDIIKCNLCCEEFDQIYIHDQDLLYKANSKYEKFKEGWYLKNAIWSGTEVIHPTCSN